MAVFFERIRFSSSSHSIGARGIIVRVLLPLTLLFCGSIATAAEPLVMGIFPRRDAAITARLFRPLSRYLEQKLQVPVSLEMSSNFDTFLVHLKQRRYDLVHLNPFDYIGAHDDLAYDALVQNEELGESTIKGAIYVRKDSGIRQITELKGKKILFGGGPRAMISYIVPTYLLQQAGLTRQDYQEAYAINPPNAVLATYLRRADAGCAGEVVRRLPLIASRIEVNQLEVIAVSRPLTHLPWAVKQEMPTALKRRLRTLMIDLKTSEEGRKILAQARLSAFNPVTNNDYDLHREIVEAVYGR